MSNYYVSGCTGKGEEIETCADDVAQFWTLYHRNDGGLSTAIIDCMSREGAETAMRVHEQRDEMAAENARMKKAIKRIFPEGVSDEKGGIGFSDAAKECYASATKTPVTEAYLNAVRAEGAASVGTLIRACAHEFPDTAEDIVEECAMIADNRAVRLRAGEPS